MNALEEFEESLSVRIGRPSDLRPFVCEGSPLSCRAFIVGFNPATEMSAGFWDFWRSGYGFDKSAWFAAYLHERQVRPLKPGKKRRPAVSNTRRVIEWILQEASPVQVLETNIYSAPTERMDDLPPEQRLAEPFRFLLDAVKPDVVVVHGKEAAAYLHGKNLATRIIEVKHFSRGWSQSAARALGQQIKQACK